MYPRVVLELLECLEGLEARIFVVETGDVTDVHAVAIEVIEKAAAVGPRVQRPANGVLYESRLGASCRELPELLDAETVGLRLSPVGQAEPSHEVFRHATAAPLREDRGVRADVGARRMVRARLALAVKAHVADAYADDAARVVEECFRRRKAREYVDSEGLGARGKDGRELPERHDEIAAIVHLRRIGQARPAALRQVPEFVAGRRHADIGWRLAPAWK